MFELVGPPCGEGCTGVLIDCVSLKSKDYFQQCSECKRECNRMSVVDKLAWVKRTLERILNDEKLS